MPTPAGWASLGVLSASYTSRQLPDWRESLSPQGWARPRQRGRLSGPPAFQKDPTVMGRGGGLAEADSKLRPPQVERAIIFKAHEGCVTTPQQRGSGGCAGQLTLLGPAGPQRILFLGDGTEELGQKLRLVRGRGSFCHPPMLEEESLSDGTTLIFQQCKPRQTSRSLLFPAPPSLL